MDKDLESKRLIVTGSTSYAIQGINLRERIEQFVRNKINHNSLRVKGKIANLKNGKVEIVFCGKESDRKRLMSYLKSINDIKDTQIHDYQVDEEFSNFTVERSDDLSEMVWALRGAGNRFVETTKALQDIHKTLEERDKNTAVGRLLTLYYELLHNRDLIIRASRRNRRRINTNALEANIKNPAISERNFVYLLSEIYSDFLDFGEGILPKRSHLPKRVDYMLKMVRQELSKRGEKI